MEKTTDGPLGGLPKDPTPPEESHAPVIPMGDPPKNTIDPTRDTPSGSWTNDGPDSPWAGDIEDPEKQL